MKNNRNMILPALAGAAIGAVAGALLSNGESRKTVTKAAKRLQRQGMDAFETVAHDVGQGARKVAPKITKSKKQQKGRG